MTEPIPLTEFCQRCQRVTPSTMTRHQNGTEFNCQTCGYQVDYLIDDDEPDFGRCDLCNHPLAENEFEICDECWSDDPEDSDE